MVSRSIWQRTYEYGSHCSAVSLASAESVHRRGQGEPFHSTASRRVGGKHPDLGPLAHNECSTQSFDEYSPYYANTSGV